MKNVLNYDEFIALAKQYYHNGGDSYVECWDRVVFTSYCTMFGNITKKDALKMFKNNCEEENELMADAKYYQSIA